MYIYSLSPHTAVDNTLRYMCVQLLDVIILYTETEYTCIARMEPNNVFGKQMFFVCIHLLFNKIVFIFHI